MSAQVTLEHVRDAYQAGDPELVNLFVRLMRDVEQPLQPPPREGVYRFEDFLVETQSSEFRRQPLDQQAQYRMEKLAKLESDDAEEPLSDRLRSHTLLLEMWEANDRFSRNCLIKLIAELPLVYGPFKALKQIFKEAEASDDTEVFGALSARFDLALSTRSHQVSQRTLAYLARRGWRYLRRIGETFPAIYPDVVTDFLIHYQGYAYQFRDTWILNHIFFHEKKIHTRTKFPLGYQVPKSWRKHRAFDDLWRRSPRPLFSLLQHSRCEPIIGYAADCLKSDFRAALRDVEASWVARLTSANVEAIDSFVVWILNNVPKFEQSKFRDLGLHDAVLKLFDSEARDAKRYAANYARTYARDLPVERLIQLINSYDSEVRKLATDLIQARDPRQEIGIDAWGELLQTERGRKIAEEALRKNFGASELTPEWFASRLQTQDESTLEFARQRLLQLHSRESLGWQYFAEVIEQVDDENWLGSDTVDFCCDQLEKLTIAEIPVDRLQRLLMHPNARQRVTDWIEMGKLKASLLGVDFLKMLAYQPSFDSDSRIAEMRQFEWGKSSLDFNESLAAQVMVWLKDVRQFSPSDLGFDWLLQLVQRSEPLYHDFATETLTKSFVPADFASEETASEETASEETVSEDGDTESDASGEAGEINIDLEGASFVFTGKLATMTRSGAQGMVTTAGGANSTSVTKRLDYLVIGDDGSPLYGQGRKGSKQTKAESLNEQGAEIKIISETAFLQMLAGEQREFSEDTVEAGCQRLWSMMCDAEKPDEPLARFARAYLRHHHPDICLLETDRPVDPGAEIPAEFLTFERVMPLFLDSRRPLRELALEFSTYEFARWAPPIDGLVAMCDADHPEVRQFVSMALTVDDTPEHRRYRVDPEVLTADAVYSFCESRKPETRRLGMKLIDLNPRLKVPEELFRLTESPDGNVRAFAIRTFWSLYRERGTTPHWKPTPPPETTTKKRRRKDPIDVGSGAPPKPESLPAEHQSLHDLLRRMLFSVPPGRPPKSDQTAADDIVKLRPLPARIAKLNLIQTLRDLAIEDAAFTKVVLPLLREFKNSRGKSERDACLVAVTRIEHQWGESVQS